MSGLSDFPAPPTLLPSRLHYVVDQGDTTITNTATTTNTNTDTDTPQDTPSDRPRLERESSYATFGQTDDEYSTIGQAL